LKNISKRQHPKRSNLIITVTADKVESLSLRQADPLSPDSQFHHQRGEGREGEVKVERESGRGVESGR
jgi:hypothetical protein